MRFLALALGLAFWPGIVGAATTPRWMVLAVGAPLLISHRPPLAVLAFLAFAAASLLWAPAGGLGDLAHWAILGLVLCLPADARTWGWLAAGIAASAAVAVAQVLPIPEVYAAIPQTATPGGLFLNRDALSEASAVGVVAAMIAGAPFLIAACAVGLALGTGKGAIIACGVGLLFLTRSRRLAAVCAALFAAALAVAAFEGFARFDDRVDLWLAVSRGLSWFGAGVGATAADFPVAAYAHCDFLQLAYEFGPAALLLLAPLPGLLRVDAPERAILATVLTEALFGFPLELPLTGFAAALAAGALVRRRAELRGIDRSRRMVALARDRWPASPDRGDEGGWPANAAHRPF